MQGKSILLITSAGIAEIKIPSLIRLLQERGYKIKMVLTSKAEEAAKELNQTIVEGFKSGKHIEPGNAVQSVNNRAGGSDCRLDPDHLRA